jgi:sec-independent protein translocase protein TatA
MLRGIGPLELLIILGIVLLIFGVGRISRVGGELGKGIRAFREGLSGKGDEGESSKDDESKPSV